MIQILLLLNNEASEYFLNIESSYHKTTINNNSEYAYQNLIILTISLFYIVVALNCHLI